MLKNEFLLSLFMIAVRYDESQIEREDGADLQTPEPRVRETYENPGLRCFRVSATQLIENHLGERFSFDNYNDKETKHGGRGIIWNGEYLEGIKMRILQWDGALKNVYISYTGTDADEELKEIREVLAEAGLVRVLLKQTQDF